MDYRKPSEAGPSNNTSALDALEAPHPREFFHDESEMKSLAEELPTVAEEEQSGLLPPIDYTGTAPGDDYAAPDIEQPVNNSIEEGFEDEPAVQEHQAMEEEQEDLMDRKLPAIDNHVMQPLDEIMEAEEDRKMPAMEPMLKAPPPPQVPEEAPAPTLLKPPPPDSAPSWNHLKSPPPPLGETSASDEDAAAPDHAAFIPPAPATMDPDEAAKAAAAAHQPATKPGAVASSSQEEADAKAKEMAAKERGEDEPLLQPQQQPPKQQQPTKKKREINKDFQDVQKTGKWGEISKAELYGIGAFVLAVIVIVVVVVSVVATRDRTEEETVLPATMPPTPAVTPQPPEEKLPILLEIWKNNPVTSQINLINDPLYYYYHDDDTEDALQKKDCATAPLECAMSWLLYQDDFPPPTDHVGTRFALANFYYALRGDNWNQNTNWLTSSSYCDWYGITCNRGRTQVEEIDFDGNNLQGEIPLALALVSQVTVISLKDNAIGGNLPGDVFAAMPNLFVLYAQDNNFTGPIPDNLRDNKSLVLLFIQHNNFEGPYPPAYCSAGENELGPVFPEFSVDCDKNPCPPTCCEPKNCFYT
ncbi:leucine Rich Repeat [Seminavis robusta]|uniref:Leucine Rich Repeat n=1 Tax=Seminavis robusta TaxID=568900 RepID=A0A9N8HWS9_9STRA|nr:leucine Rich Repeat [Seminavis robusta]|eukprot:Sro2034_g311960.1 leucine Rich Repeat (586) ;mRNA; f:1021-2869